MNLSPKLESALRERVAERVLCESQRDVDSLYGFIDPAIRKSRCDKYDFEPELTIQQIHDYTLHIDSAELVEFAIDGCGVGPRDGRENVLTAIVLSTVSYNGGDVVKEYRTPWVLYDGQWYTTSVGKIRPSQTSQEL